MRYYKMIEGGYLTAVGTGYGGTEIDKDQYDEIIAIIKSRPEAPDGHEYRLNEDLTWDLVDLPESEEELTAEEALDLLLSGVTE